MAIDASEAGSRLAALIGDYVFESGLDPGLQIAERHFVILWKFQAEAYNGGIWQFFTNSTGETAPYVCEALEAIGADELVAPMKRALAESRPGTAWFEASRKSAALYLAGDDVKKCVYSINDEMSPHLDELSVKLFKYLARHRDQFDMPDDFWEEGALQ